MGWLDWLSKENTPQEDTSLNHWEWLYMFLSSAMNMIPEEQRKKESVATKLFAFQLGAMQGMAEAYNLKFSDAFNGYQAVLNKDAKPVQDDEALARMVSTICQDPHLDRYRTEGRLVINRAVLEKDTQAVGRLYSLISEDPAEAEADFQSGLDAYNRKDNALALKKWLPLAEQGHAEAQYYVGELFLQGEGVPHDDAQAREWYLKAARQGHLEAQTRLGIFYFFGMGVPQDHVQAREWYRKAAAQGNTEAQWRLGHLYHVGWGVPLDYRQAREWYLKAATQGDATAQFLLGQLYQEGRGVLQDYVQAHMWYNIAAAHQRVGTLDLTREEIAKKMTLEQVAEAQRLAREWLA